MGTNWREQGIEWYSAFRDRLTSDSDMPKTGDDLSGKHFHVRDVTLEEGCDTRELLSAANALANKVDEFLSGVASRDALQRAWQHYGKVKAP